MKKFFMWLVGLLVVVIVLLFVLLFTAFGNNLLKPYIQAQIDKHSPIPVSLDVFNLRFGSFEFELSALSNIRIISDGTFSLFSQSIDGILNIKLEKPSDIKELDGIHLDDNFLIENVIRGKIMDFVVNTSSQIADGGIKIDTQIKGFSPNKIFANIENLKIESLLKVLGQEPYINGVFNLKADIDGDSDMNFNGKANAEILNGNVSSNLVKRDFKITIPATNFILNLDADFDGKQANHNLRFLSSVGNIKSKGSTIIKGLKTNATYDININNLAPLTPIIGMPIQGSFKTNGKITSNANWLNIDGETDFASSDTTYSVSLEGYTKPKDAIINISNMKVEDVLHTLLQPIYAKALLNAKVNLKNVSGAISGDYSHTLKGDIQKVTIKQNFDLDLNENLPFAHNADIVFTKGVGKLNANILSNIANLNISGAALMLDEGTSLNAPYTLEIPDLKKIAFVTSKELKGDLKATGLVKYNSNDSLYADIKSEILGGSFDAKLNGNIADVNLLNIKTKDLLDMLQYPQFFETDINGKVKYDIITQKGTIDLVTKSGHFTSNKLTDLLLTTLKFDATKEVYDDIKIAGTINKKVINANLSMTSSNTSLTSNNAKINMDTDALDAYLMLKIKDNELGATLKGSASSPKITLDTKKLAKDVLKNVINNPKVQEQREKLEEKLEEQKGKINNKINDAISNGLNKLFKK